MTKKIISSITVLGVILVAYVVLALMIPFLHTPLFWIGFAFGIIGIFVSALGFISAFHEGDGARSKFYGFPVARIAAIYLIIQLIVSFLLMGFSLTIPNWVGLVVCIILLLAALLGYIAADAARDEIQRQDEQMREDVTSMRALQSKVNVLAANCQNPEAKNAIQKLANEFRYSDPVSSNATRGIEGQMWSFLGELENAVMKGDTQGTIWLTNKLSGMLQERNRICKLTKQS